MSDKVILPQIDNWSLLTAKKDAISDERLRWSSHRNNVLQEETIELDEKLERLDHKRFAAYQNLDRQVKLTLLKVGFDGNANTESIGIAKENSLRRRQLYLLSHEDMTMSARPCKWKRRYQLSKKIWQSIKEAIICKNKISKLEVKIKKLKPKAVDPKKLSSDFDKNGSQSEPKKMEKIMDEGKKNELIDTIKKAIADGSEVCIYRGDDLKDNDFPTNGVGPVYKGNNEVSALSELNGAFDDALEWGRLEIFRTNEVLKGPHDIINFDFRN